MMDWVTIVDEPYDPIDGGEYEGVVPVTYWQVSTANGDWRELWTHWAVRDEWTGEWSVSLDYVEPPGPPGLPLSGWPGHDGKRRLVEVLQQLSARERIEFAVMWSEQPDGRRLLVEELLADSSSMPLEVAVDIASRLA